MSVYGVLNETLESTNYLYRLSMYESNFLDNIFNESYNDFEAINEAIDFKKIKEKLNWKNIWEWIKGIFAKLGEAISNLVKKIKDFFTGKKKKETEAKLKALEKEMVELKFENLSLKKDKKELEKEINDVIDRAEDRLKGKDSQYDELVDKYVKAGEKNIDLKDKLDQKEKELDDAKNKEAYAKAEAKNYKAKYKAIITKKYDILKEGAEQLDLYFNVYDVMDPNYHPIKIVRSDWFDGFASFFESYDKEGNLKHSNAPDDIVGYFDEFIEKNGDKLNIFNDTFVKKVGADTDVKHNYYSFDSDKILKAIDECKEARKAKEKIQTFSDATKYAILWNNSIHGQANDINELILQFADVNKRAVSLLDKVIKQCSAENPDPGVTKLQHFQEELNKFIRLINNQIQLLTILSNQCAKTLRVIDNIAGASAVSGV